MKAHLKHFQEQIAKTTNLNGWWGYAKCCKYINSLPEKVAINLLNNIKTSILKSNPNNRKGIHTYFNTWMGNISKPEVTPINNLIPLLINQSQLISLFEYRGNTLSDNEINPYGHLGCED